MGETQQISLELDRAVPGLEGEGRTPHEPEIGFEEVGLEVIRDGTPSKESFGFQSQTFNGQDVFLAQAEFGSIDAVPLPEKA